MTCYASLRFWSLGPLPLYRHNHRINTRDCPTLGSKIGAMEDKFRIGEPFHLPSSTQGFRQVLRMLNKDIDRMISTNASELQYNFAAFNVRTRSFASVWRSASLELWCIPSPIINLSHVLRFPAPCNTDRKNADKECAENLHFLGITSRCGTGYRERHPATGLRVVVKTVISTRSV
jgi:hypothetical protein